MNGVESTRITGMVYPVFGHHGSPPGFRTYDHEPESLSAFRAGPLISSRETVKQSLGGDGYVEITGRLHANFEVYLTRKPVEMAIEDLKPGLLCDIAAWVAGEISAAPEPALGAQAHVRPGMAVKLLT